MKQLLYILISIITLCAFVCCSDKDELEVPGGTTDNKWENHIPLNKNDSIAISVLFKNLEIEDTWALENSIDVYDYHNWDSTNFTFYMKILTKHDEVNNEMRIYGISVYPTCVIPFHFQIPKEISLMDSLTLFSIVGQNANADVQIPKEIFDCPLEYFEISGKIFSGSIPTEIKKVSSTLKELRIYYTYISGFPEELAGLQNLTKPALFTNNNIAGKVPLFFRELPYGAILDDNNYSEMDWRYFTEDIGVVPYIRNN